MNFIKRYPKLLALLCSMVVAYAAFMSGALYWLHDIGGPSVYLASFIAGALFTFGFTAAFGIAMFVEIAVNISPLHGALIGACGAMLSDLAIFHIMRFEMFHEEITHLRTSKLFRSICGILHHEKFPEKARHYLMWAFAGIIIASPMPDEFGVALVSSLTEINKRAFAFLCFSLNACGIFLLLGSARLALG